MKQASFRIRNIKTGEINRFKTPVAAGRILNFDPEKMLNFTKHNPYGVFMDRYEVRPFADDTPWRWTDYDAYMECRYGKKQLLDEYLVSHPTRGCRVCVGRTGIIQFIGYLSPEVLVMGSNSLQVGPYFIERATDDNRDLVKAGVLSHYQSYRLGTEEISDFETAGAVAEAHGISESVLYATLAKGERWRRDGVAYRRWRNGPWDTRWLNDDIGFGKAIVGFHNGQSQKFNSIRHASQTINLGKEAISRLLRDGTEGRKGWRFVLA